MFVMLKTLLYFRYKMNYMNKTKDQIILSFQEGGIKNYLQELEFKLGGEIINNGYINKKSGFDMKVSIYSFINDFELIVSESTPPKDLIFDRIPDDRPNYYHINIIKEGQVIQDFNSEQQFLQAGTPKGIFIYNGLFPLKSNFPAKVTLRSIAFKLSKKTLSQFMPEAVDIVDKLFENDEPKGYHTHLSAEMDRMTDDLYHYETADFGRVPMVTSKGLALFTVLMSSIKKLADKDELHGLHKDDYYRLLKIKDEIVSNVTSMINIETLAEQFAISVSKLQRDFKTLFNCTVYQFFAHAKMDEAYRRLKSGNYSVTEVGYDLGYSSISKFSEMFKKVKGISPKEVIPV